MAATTPITPNVINTSAKVKPFFIFSLSDSIMSLYDRTIAYNPYMSQVF